MAEWLTNWLVFIMKTYKNLYQEIYSMGNLTLAWRKARKGKTKKKDIKEFEENIIGNLLDLHFELKNQTYKPMPLETFVLRDPKTRKISKADFRDRVVHHAIINILEPIFDKTFIYDSCANRKGKGNLFAIKRFDKFKRKVSRNGKVVGQFNDNQVEGYYLKADIKHYFQEVNHEILIKSIQRKIRDKKVIWLIKSILDNGGILRETDTTYLQKSMPLGNLTSQFFANIYLNELDYFVKHKLKAKYYIRYVDDFVILHKSNCQLIQWKKQINEFLNDKLKLKLHSDKSKIVSLSRGIDFVGFRDFYYFKLLRKRNIRSMQNKIIKYSWGLISFNKLTDSFQGWQAYADWSDSSKLKSKLSNEIIIQNYLELYNNLL